MYTAILHHQRSQTFQFLQTAQTFVCDFGAAAQIQILQGEKIVTDCFERGVVNQCAGQVQHAHILQQTDTLERSRRYAW